ncbi:hypothetical protein CTAYLR_006535 [Chrysophaeum taylorii]|uniref:Poly [ADP-ribose] polymerase n=1 Tax=Chrysophaeum taylorii TaxID=2483200 RepID=A0AAD7UHN3_9STRA|nr:hypothetical protein CTAYLR_006535 [Chrysophaeum taylorii]
MIVAGRVLLLAVAAAELTNRSQLTLVVSQRVVGAVYPVNASGTECSWARYNETPCECLGGGARLAGVLSRAEVALDSGGYWYGSGLFYDQYEGAASAAVARASGYGARALHWLDFVIAWRPLEAEPTGGRALARFLSAVGDGLRAVATNLDVADDPYLTTELTTKIGFVERGGKTIAILALLDARRIAEVSPHYSARCMPYEEALTAAIATARDADFVVLFVSGMPERDVFELVAAAEARNATEAEGLRTLARKFFDIDVIIVDGRDTLGAALGGAGVEMVENLAGGRTAIVVTDDSKRGVATSTVRYDGSTWTTANEMLDCRVAENATVRAKIDAWKWEIEAKMRDEVAGALGFVATSLDDAQLTDLVCDAGAYWAQADIAVVAESGAHAPLISPRVHAQELLEALPNLGKELVWLRVRGSTLHALLPQAIAYRPEGAVHVSRSTRVTWYVVDNGAILYGSVTVNGTEIDDDATYSVVATVNGVEETFRAVDPTVTYAIPLGVSSYGAAAAYLRLFHGTTEDALDPEAEYALRRIEQLGNVRLVRVALLCGDTVSRLQLCDHALHAIRLLNGDIEGIPESDVSPVRVEPHVVNIGCSEGRALEGLANLSLATQTSFDAVVTDCSDDVRAVSSIEGRAKLNEITRGLQGWNHVVVSPSATAPSLADNDAYPYLVRLATASTFNGLAVAAMMAGYGWHLVAVIHDDSSFATEAAQAFVDKFLADDPANNRVLGNGACKGPVSCARSVTGTDGAPVGIAFSLSAMDDGLVSASEILDAVDALGAKIVYLSTYQRVQRIIYGQVARSAKLYGLGYAWINSLPSESAVVDEDTGIVDNDAADGLRGALGFIEHTPTLEDGTITFGYYFLWEAASPSSGNCVYPTVSDKVDFCDLDDDPYTTPDYALFWVDAMAVYASSLEELIESTRNVSAIHDPAMVVNAILSRENLEGVTGTITLDASGGRRGNFDGLNFRVEQSVTTSRRRLIELSKEIASYQEIGTYFSAVDVFNVTDDVYFPGDTTTPPADSDPAATSNNKKSDSFPQYILWAVYALVAVLVVAVAFIAYLVTKNRKKQKTPDIYIAVRGYKITERGYVLAKGFAPEMSPRDDPPVHLEENTPLVVEPRPRTYFIDRWEFSEDDSREMNQSNDCEENDDDDEDDELCAASDPSLASSCLASLWRDYADKDQTEISHSYRDWLHSKHARAAAASSSAGLRRVSSAASSAANKHMVSLGTYEVNMRDMLHVDRRTGKERRVRKIGKREVQMRWFFGETWYKVDGCSPEFLPDFAFSVNLKGDEVWKRFPPDAEAEVSEAFCYWLNNDRNASGQIYFTDHFELTRASDANARTGYVIDFVEMMQTKLSSFFKRKLAVVVVPANVALPVLVEEAKEEDLGESETMTVDVTEYTEVPDELLGKDLIEELVRGDLVAVSPNHKPLDLGTTHGVWGRGAVVGSTAKGWFPMACVDFKPLEKRVDTPTLWTLNKKEHVLDKDLDRVEWEDIVERLPKLDIVSITRIQDRIRWRAYNAALNSIREEIDRGPLVENVLGYAVDCVLEHCPVFHGTDHDKAEAITNTGFEPQLADLGSKLGRGSYFAIEPALAELYAHPDDDGVCNIFVCRIITGFTTEGKQGISEPEKGYHSTTDDKQAIFCIFHKTHAYPLYRVRFKYAAKTQIN